jgi:hypothetical protein
VSLVVSEGQLWYEKVKDWQFNFDQLTVYNLILDRYEKRFYRVKIVFFMENKY